MNFPTTLPVNYSNTSTFYPDDTGTLGSFTKTPDAKTMVSLDYTELLTENNLTSLMLNNVSYKLNYGTAPQLIISGTTINGTNNVLSFLVSGGLNGVKYLLTITANLSDGSSNTQQLEIVVSGGIVTEEGCAPYGTRLAGSLPMGVGMGGVGPPVPKIFQQGQILNGDGTRFGTTFIVFWVDKNPPLTANILDRWYNLQDGLVYDRVTDGATVFWLASAIGGQGGGGGGGFAPVPNYYTSTTTPQNPNLGDFWYNPNTGVYTQYINTGTTMGWYTIGVSSGPSGPSGITGEGPTYYINSMAPITPNLGDFWLNTTTDELSMWMNTSLGLNWYGLQRKPIQCGTF